MNAGRKDDSEKARLDLLPPRAMLAMGRVLTHGANRYGGDNWRKVEGAKERYYAATMRHLLAYASGEEIDPDSKEHHLAHAMCSVSFVLELELLEALQEQLAVGNLEALVPDLMTHERAVQIVRDVRRWADQEGNGLIPLPDKMGMAVGVSWGEWCAAVRALMSCV